MLENDLLLKVKSILDVNENSESNLLAILLEVQSIVSEKYISKEVAKFISKEIGVPLSRVYDVITFYSALSDKPRGEHIIQICNSTACKVNKFKTLKEALEEQLGIKVGETTEDGKFTLECTPCFGACDISPAFRIGEDFFGHLTEEKIKVIIERFRGMSYEKHSQLNY